MISNTEPYINKGSLGQEKNGGPNGVCALDKGVSWNLNHFKMPMNRKRQSKEKPWSERGVRLIRGAFNKAGAVTFNAFMG